MSSRFLPLAIAFAIALPAAAQVPVGAGGAGATSTVARAEGLVGAGRSAEATELLGRYLSETPGDGRAWFFLGRIYLGDLKQWHLHNHQGGVPGPILTDLASVAFDQAQQLLTDSGGVFRTLVTVEAATARIEDGGWNSAMARRYDAGDLPLPTVVAELGQNLLASCPSNALVLTGTDVEVAAVWGVRMQSGTRGDLILLRPDLYQADPLYRVQMARVLAVDPASDLRSMIARVRERRPVCLTPGIDTLTAPDQGWKASRLAMVSSARPVNDSSRTVPDLAVHQLARVGLAGSVWSSHIRELYEVAARLNPSLCGSLFRLPNAALPTIMACKGRD